jgi:hypothetical protein
MAFGVLSLLCALKKKFPEASLGQIIAASLEENGCYAENLPLLSDEQLAGYLELKLENS